jgi:hypothetical protein
MTAITAQIPDRARWAGFKRKAWAEVIRENPVWFSADSIDFWGTEVAWLSIHPVGANNYLFVTEDYTFDRSEKKFSIREAINGGGIHTHDFQTFETIEEATERLYEYVLEEERVSGIQQVW